MRLGQLVRIARLLDSPINGTVGVVTHINGACPEGFESSGLITVKTRFGEPTLLLCERDNLDDLNCNLDEMLMRRPSLQLVSSLRYEGAAEAMAKMRLLMCWQVVVGFIGFGSVGGWVLSSILHLVWTWTGGGVFSLCLGFWIIHTLDGMVLGITPQWKRWVEEDRDRLLLPSSGAAMPVVACFAGATGHLGAVTGVQLLLVASSWYHCQGALTDFDQFTSDCKYRPSPAEADEAAQDAFVSGLKPYGRLGLGIGMGLFLLLPLRWTCLGSFVINTFSLMGRFLNGFQAISAATALAAIVYWTLSQSGAEDHTVVA